MRYLVATTCLTVGLVLASAAQAAEPAKSPASTSMPSAQQTRDDIKNTLGSVPTFFERFPEVGLPAAWAEMKAIQLNPDTKLSGKEKELIGLAVAAQIPCDYCVYFHTEAAKLNGATDEEVKEAIAMAAITRHWSTVLNGSQLDKDDFRKEAAAVFEHARQSQTAQTPADKAR